MLRTTLLLSRSLSFYRLLSAFDLVLQVGHALLVWCFGFGGLDLTEAHIGIYATNHINCTS